MEPYLLRLRRQKWHFTLSLLIMTLSAWILGPVYAFNVDTRHAQIHRRPNSGFGYSVDFVYRTEKRDKFTLLVGAPFAQSAQNRRLRSTGAVYGCEVDANLCVEIYFDQKQGNELRLNGSALLPIEEKSNQMFGATVVASKNADSVLACAPHYKYFFSKFEVIEPVGTCFYAQNYFNNIKEFAPCRQEPARHGRHRFGYGMCGFSAAVPDDGTDRLFISAPGVWYWQGATYSQNINNVTDRPHTADGPAHTDHHQLGYSTAAGDFDGDKRDDVVVGVPRGNELIGMVSIYTRDLRPILNLTDMRGQRGQYFGASLAVVDLNNDGLDDLVVGSPLYIDYQNEGTDNESDEEESAEDQTSDGRGVYSGKAYQTVLQQDLKKTQERKPRYDIGKISVYIQTAASTFKAPIQIVGQGQWGRFGYSVAAAGDLNGDGFQDLIVGAPYDGEDGRGVVYVYHGAEDGIRRKFTQRILARDISRDIRTFGFSLRGGRDVDGNGYPDIAVGAYQSSQAAVLRTRPVMQVTGFSRTTRKAVNLDEKLCVTEFGRMPCEKLRLCLKYSGKLPPEYNSAEMKLNIQLDSKKPLSPRAFLSRKDLDKKRGVRIDPASVSKDQPDKIEHTLQMSKGREHCETYDVYIPDTIRDKISPIVISANYSYVERGGPGLEPAVDTTLAQTLETELIIEKDCGEDNICVPDLQIQAHPATEKFTVGATDQTLTLNVTVENRGEDSYLTQYTVTIPPGFEYGGIENYETKHSVTCSPAERDASDDKDKPYTFVCDIGNPLPAGARAAFGFKITGTPELDVSREFVEIGMGVNSTNEEAAGREGDNQMLLRVPIEVKAQLNLVGRSNPEQVDYSIRNRTQGDAATFDFEVGPVVSHLFQVINRGPSAISGATLDIYWPSYSHTGKHLLYLIDMPFISDPSKAKCRVNQAHNVNPANLAISNEHVPTPSPIGGPGVHGRYADGEDEGTETMTEDHPPPPEEDDYYPGPGVRRSLVKRQVDEVAVRRNLKAQKAEMKEAVRQAKEAGTAIEYHGTLSRSTVNCAALNCTHIECDIGRLEEDEFVLVEIFARLWVNTLIDVEAYEADISSFALARISSLPYAPKYTPLPQLIAVNTDVNPTDPDQGWSIPWWLWLLAILIALLILLLIIYCCYRVGFFKRNRPHLEKAKLSRGPPPGEAAAGGGYYADDGARYAQPQTYSQERHGARV